MAEEECLRRKAAENRADKIQEALANYVALSNTTRHTELYMMVKNEIEMEDLAKNISSKTMKSYSKQNAASRDYSGKHECPETTLNNEAPMLDAILKSKWEGNTCDIGDQHFSSVFEQTELVAQYCNELQQQVAAGEALQERWKQACRVLSAEALTKRRSREEADMLLLVKQQQLDKFKKIVYPQMVSRQNEKVETLQRSLSAQLERTRDAENKLDDLHKQLDIALSQMVLEKEKSEESRARVEELEAEIKKVQDELLMQEEKSRVLHEKLSATEDQHERERSSFHNHLCKTKQNLVESHTNIDKLEKALEAARTTNSREITPQSSISSPGMTASLKSKSPVRSPSQTRVTSLRRFWQEQAQVRNSPQRHEKQIHLGITSAAFEVDCSKDGNEYEDTQEPADMQEFQTPDGKSPSRNASRADLQASPLAVAFLTPRFETAATAEESPSEVRNGLYRSDLGPGFKPILCLDGL